MVRGSHLADVTVRKELVHGGNAAVAASTDPMIRLARDVDAAARAVRKIVEDQVDGVQAPQYALIARALFEDQGTSAYPDATFTLRLAFGVVKGIDADGQGVPALYHDRRRVSPRRRDGDADPYKLPERWLAARTARRLNVDTPLNFATTADTIGGNSGSPLIDRNGAVIGLNFDRNRYGLARDFGYDDRLGRNIAVDVRGITEALTRSTWLTPYLPSCGATHWKLTGSISRRATSRLHVRCSTSTIARRKRFRSSRKS